jgi:site-specific DNA-methyltransferase (adenine-specific)
MTIESTNDNTHTTSAITYSECYAQVFLGDCLELYKNLEPKSIDLILTDLPYGTTACKWDTIIPFDKLWEMVNYLLKPNGAFITTTKQPFTSKLVCSNIGMLKESLVWIKHKPTNFANGKYMHLNYTEDLMVFGNGRLTYNPQRQPRKSERVKQAQNGNSKNWRSKPKQENEVAFSTDYEPREWNVYDADTKLPMNYIELPSVVSNSNEKCNHPTQKPVALFEYLLKTYSNEGMTIFDPCMGSGTTGVACKNLNRNFIGIEKDEAYFKIAEQRINARTLFS